MFETIYEDLLKACRQPGCPICHLEHDAVDLYLQTAFRRQASDLVVQQELRESFGLCWEHSWRMLNLGLGNTIAAAIGYHDVLLTIVQQLQHVDLELQPPKRFLSLKKQIPEPLVDFEAVTKALNPRQRCLTCRLRDNFSHSALNTWMDSLQEQYMHSAIISSEGLCLPHLRQLFELVQDAEMCKELISMNIERVETLRRKFGEMIRQIEQRNDRKLTQDEEDAWKIVVSFITGER